MASFGVAGKWVSLFLNTGKSYKNWQNAVEKRENHHFYGKTVKGVWSEIPKNSS